MCNISFVKLAIVIWVMFFVNSSLVFSIMEKYVRGNFLKQSKFSDLFQINKA